MKRFVLLIFGIIYSLSGISQIDFISDTSHALLFPELTKNVNALDSRNNDFQYRIWLQSGGLIIPQEYSLYVVTLNKGSWQCKKYQTRNFENSIKSSEYNEKDTVLFLIHSSIVGYDSIVKWFYKNDFLSLPSMASISELDRSKYNISDCSTYYFELISKNKYRRYRYYCPQEFLKHFPKIKELQQVTNILAFIESRNK